MPLSEEERATLKRLQQKEKEPAAAPVGKTVHVNIDAGDPKQIAWGIKKGFIDPDEVEEDGNGSEGEEDGDDAPRRKGYFNQ